MSRFQSAPAVIVSAHDSSSFAFRSAGTFRRAQEAQEATERVVRLRVQRKRERDDAEVTTTPTRHSRGSTRFGGEVPGRRGGAPGGAPCCSGWVGDDPNEGRVSGSEDPLDGWERGDWVVGGPDPSAFGHAVVVGEGPRFAPCHQSGPAGRNARAIARRRIADGGTGRGLGGGGAASWCSDPAVSGDALRAQYVHGPFRGWAGRGACCGGATSAPGIGYGGSGAPGAGRSSGRGRASARAGRAGCGGGGAQ